MKGHGIGFAATPTISTIPPPLPQSAVEQRDTLVEENRQLAVANEQYKGRTEEFKSLMMTLTVSDQTSV